MEYGLKESLRIKNFFIDNEDHPMFEDGIAHKSSN